MSRRTGFLIVVVFLLVIVFFSSVFVVNPRQYALIFKFGKWQRTVAQPGLHFKIPAPFESVVFLDNRLQSIEAGDSERIQTSEKKNLIIDSFVKWRISDPLQFYVSFGDTPARAQDRLNSQVRDALNASVNVRTVKEVVSLERDKVMAEVSKNISERARPLGIEVVDVRLKRIEYSEEVSDSVYRRMRAERAQEAKLNRSNGEAKKEKIQAQADREVQEVLAKARAKAEEIRGEGDAIASETYAKAYGKDLDFYRFYGTLSAYRSSLQGHKNTLIVNPDSDFLQFLDKASD